MKSQPTIVTGSVGAAIGIALVAALIAGVCALCDA